jgi:hypothetical protein
VSPTFQVDSIRRSAGARHALGAALLVSCLGRPKPPPPAPPPPPIVIEAPPIPKCESLAEACIVKPGTRARIQQTGWGFEPPPQWTYAQGADATIAGSKSAILIISSQANEATGSGNNETFLRSVAEQIKVVLPKRKRLLPKKPDKVQDVGELHLSLYQLDGAVREENKGALLVFTTKLPQGPALLGAAFVSDDDAENSDQAIFKAIESIELSTPRGEGTSK